MANGHIQETLCHYFFQYFIYHCFICCPSDYTVSEDAGIEPREVATRLNLIDYYAKSHPLSAKPIHTRRNLIHIRLNLIHIRLNPSTLG